MVENRSSHRSSLRTYRRFVAKLSLLVVVWQVALTRIEETTTEVFYNKQSGGTDHKLIWFFSLTTIETTGSRSPKNSRHSSIAS